MFPKIFFILNLGRDSNFNRSNILDKLEGDNCTFDLFKTLVLKNIDARDSLVNISNNSDQKTTDTNNKKSITSTNDLENIGSYIDENNIDYNNLNNADIIDIQKKQLEQMEKEENLKRKKEEEKKKEEARLLKEQAEKEQKEKLLKEEKLKTLPSEPVEGDPNASLIILRYPHSEERAERRFLKTEKIQVLYDYVTTLGSDIFEESGEFELMQPFPFKIYNDKEKTLEEEKLFPNAVLQIRENE